MANRNSDDCHTPEHPRRRDRSSSSETEVIRHKRSRPSDTGLTTEDLLKLISALQNNSSKTTPITNVIPEFDPDNKSQDVERWLNKVNECSSIYGWDDKQTTHYALQKLRGLAKRWYESLPSIEFSWVEWQAKFRKAFPNDINYGKLLDEMLDRKSRTDETLRDYFYDKLTLLSRCEIFGRKAVDCIIYGITDNSIRNGAQVLKCEEPEDLLNYLSSQRQHSFKDFVRGPVASTSFRKRELRTNINTSNRLQASSRGNEVVCFNCNERGHTYYSCSQPLTKCVKCGRIGHNSVSCIRKPLLSHNNQNNQSSEKKVLRVTLSENSVLEEDPDTIGLSANKTKLNDFDSIFHKNISVNGLNLKAFIDFGSDCSLIQFSVAKTLALSECAGPLPTIRGFGNSFVKPKFQSNVKVTIDEVDTNLNVLIVDDAYLSTPMLIGQNFTESPSITVMKDSNRLVFYYTPPADTHGRDILELFVANDVVINRGGLVDVYSKGNYSGDIYSNGSTRTGPNQEYHLHQGCYRIENNKTTIFISALTSVPLVFRAHTLIARVIPIAEAKIFKIQADIAAHNLSPLERNDIKIGENIDRAVCDRLLELLQKYRDCFASNLSELGCAKDAVMNIELTDKTPVVYRPYRLSHSERQNVRTIIDDLLINDIIQESNSNYASPILLVRKKNGESRLCVDYRSLNNKTVKDKYPLPLIDDQLSNLSGNKFFITLDLASGYYQIPMGKDSQHMTAFVTPDGHYEFKRMPFGLANAPSVFQRTMNQILGTRRFKSALAYMDDLLIPSSTIEEGFERLEDVLKLIRDAGLTLKLEKCKFFDTTIEYLGYEISSDGIKPSEKKIISVRDFPTPNNVHEVRQFLGLANYFRRFVKGFGQIAKPLTVLLKKDSPWKWSTEETNSFESLKSRLIERPLLALYSPVLDTEVHTDASSLGLGGILMQWQTSPRVLKPVAYFSRQTTPEERHFHSYELETLAVVCTLKKFRPYLLGLNFTVYTDCNALRTTLTKRDLIPRIARWWLQMSEYNFTIEYRPGCRMSHVDALSRNPPTFSEVVSTLSISTDNWILTLQMADSELERIHKILKPNLDNEVVEIKKNYVIKNHTLYRKLGEDVRLVIPKDARWQICKANHDDVGHLGVTKTLERIQSRYWFAKMRRYVKKYVSACIECAFHKDNSSQARSGFLHPVPKIEQPFHTLHLDHLGPFIQSKSRNNYILTIVDGFTKYLLAKPVKDTKTKSVIKVLEKIFVDFATPNRIISDRGTAFTSAQFKHFCSSRGIKHILNAVACPRANGQAERFNQTILTALSTQCSDKDERTWDEQLGKVQWGINNTINASTKKSASELLFGTKFNCPIDNMLTLETQENNRVPVDSIASVSSDNNCVGSPSSDFENISAKPSEASNNLNSVRQEAAKNIKISQERQKRAFDAKRVPAISYNVGELVKITKTCFKNDGKSKKLLPKFTGPYKITKCLGNDRYEISNVPGFNLRKYDAVVAADRMRPWINLKALEVNGSSGSASDDSDNDD